MSNRTRDIIYSRHPDDRQVLSQHKRESKRRITGTPAQKANGFIMSDLKKVIDGRHGGQCDHPVWAKRYFRVALPQVCADARRIVAAGGSEHEAVRDWVTEFVPILRLIPGDEWIDAETDKHLAKPKGRRCPRIDRTNGIIDLQEGEREGFEICSLSEVSRPRAVRKVERKAKSADRSRGHRAKVDGYTPRSESKAAQIRAAGGNVNSEKSRQRRARIKAEKAALEAAMHPAPCPGVTAPQPVDPTPQTEMHPVSYADLSDAHPVPYAAWVSPPCTRFRTQHLEFPRAPIPRPTGDDLDLAAAEAQTTVAEWHRYLHENRASTIYGLAPLPTPEEHAATMVSLHAGAASAWAEFGAVAGF